MFLDIIKKLFCKKVDTEKSYMQKTYMTELLKREQFNTVLLHAMSSNMGKENNYLISSTLTYKQKFKIYSEEPIENKVIRILKYDFERYYGMSFNEFMKSYNAITNRS